MRQGFEYILKYNGIRPKIFNFTNFDLIDLCIEDLEEYAYSKQSCGQYTMLVALGDLLED